MSNFTSIKGVLGSGGSVVNATNTIKGVVKLSTPAADVSNPIVVGDNDSRMPTSNEKAALAGTSGAPSSSNKFVTNSDTRLAATGTSAASIVSGGTKIQSGTSSAANSGTVTFPTAFATTPKVTASVFLNDATPVTDQYSFVIITTKSTTNFTYEIYNDTGGRPGGPPQIDWIAIGT